MDKIKQQHCCTGNNCSTMFWFIFNFRVCELLQGGAIMNKSYQPHEAHIPYLLQLFIDYNLYGMNLINLAAVKFRKARRKSKDFFLTTKQLFWGLKITIFLTLWSNGYYILFPFRLYSVSKLNLCIAFHRFSFLCFGVGEKPVLWKWDTMCKKTDFVSIVLLTIFHKIFTPLFKLGIRK